MPYRSPLLDQFHNLQRCRRQTILAESYTFAFDQIMLAVLQTWVLRQLGLREGSNASLIPDCSQKYHPHVIQAAADIRN